MKAILEQEGEPPEVRRIQWQLKMEEKRKLGLEQKEEYDALMEELVTSPDLQRSVRAASEKGASAWLTACATCWSTDSPCTRERFVTPWH